MKKSYLIVLIVTLVLMTSCKKDFMETELTGSVDESAIFTSTTNASNVINGVYRYLYSRYSEQNQPGHGGVMLMLDFMGEDMHQAAASWYTSSGSGTGGWVTHRNSNSGYVAYPFRLYYRTIGNVNALIENIDAATGPQSEKNKLKAEALSMRAWSYFNLVQIYAKRYQPGTTNSQPGLSMPLSAKDVKLPRVSVEEIYTQINKDLDEAITLFAEAAPVRNKSHISVHTARGIKARVALTQGNYAAAAEWAEKVVKESPYSLMSPAQYQSGFNDINNPEWIWGAFVQDDQGDTFGSYFAQISYNGNTTYVRSRPKRINAALYALIPDTDVRKKMWEPAPTAANFPLPTTAFSREPYMSRKFSIRTLPTIGDVPYMRLAEMYLIMAEAYARIPGKEGEAREALNTLVRSRDAGFAGSTSSGQALIDEILIQRRIELWAEGFRFFDLKRLNQPLDRTAVPNFAPASVGGVMQIPAGDSRWQFVLPISELQANPNSSQNE